MEDPKTHVLWREDVWKISLPPTQRGGQVLKAEFKLLLFLFLFCLCVIYVFSGCVSLKYQGVEYYRVGDQHIKSLAVETIRPDGSIIKVTLESQDSEATALTNAVNVLGGLAGAAK